MSFDLTRAKQLYEEGYTLFAISQLLGCSEAVVAHRLKRANVQMRRRGRPCVPKEPEPDPWEGMKPPSPTPKMVKCLGPLCWGQKMFLSRDPANVRRCPACQDAVKSLTGDDDFGGRRSWRSQYSRSFYLR